MKKQNIMKLIISIIICQLAGIIGSIATSESVGTWYAMLEKPFFTPPSWLFAPVWITLYFLMGLSLYLVWIKGYKKNKEALTAFGIQLALNITWSFAFFGLRSPLLGMINIIVLWFAITTTMMKFRRISKNAYYLLIPYITWVTIASILNFSILILNI